MNINLCKFQMMITPSVDYNLRLKRFDTQLNEPTNLNSAKGSNLIEQMLLCLGTTCLINSPMSPISLTKFQYDYF